MTKRSLGLVLILFLSHVPPALPASGHWGWFEIQPEEVMQGGSFRVIYNISKYRLELGQLISSETRMLEFNLTIGLPRGLTGEITSVNVSSDGYVFKQIEGMSLRIYAQGGEILDIRVLAQVNVSLDSPIGPRQIETTGRSIEIVGEGAESPRDYRVRGEVEVMPFEPIFLFSIDKEVVEPPGTLVADVYIGNGPPMPPFTLHNLTLWIEHAFSSEPIWKPIKDVWGRSVLPPKAYYELGPMYIRIGPESRGGRYQIAARLEFYLEGESREAIRTVNLTVHRTTTLNLSVEAPSKVRKGSTTTIHAKIINTGSFEAEDVIVVAELGEEREVQGIGEMASGELRELEIHLPVVVSENSTINVQVYWRDEYPSDQRQISVEIPVTVEGGLPVVPMLVGSVALVVVIGWWFYAKRTVEHKTPD